LNQIQNTIGKVLSTFERGLNAGGYIPILSTFSGALRIKYGQIEVIGSIVAAALTAIAALFNPSKEAREQGLNRATEILTTYACHGIANIFRGVIEAIPFLSFVTCLPYDLLGNRFAYPHEAKSPLQHRPAQNLQTV
jgi:hypothetical protein